MPLLFHMLPFLYSFFDSSTTVYLIIQMKILNPTDVTSLSSVNVSSVFISTLIALTLHLGDSTRLWIRQDDFRQAVFKSDLCSIPLHSSPPSTEGTEMACLLP